MNKNCDAVLPFSQKGVFLLEALIAILIFSVGILGLVGLQSTMARNTTEAGYRSEANYIAQQVLGAMWANPCNLGDYAGETDISGRLPNGALTVVNRTSGYAPTDSCGNGQVIDQTVVTVAWRLPGESEAHSVVNSASITGG